jgi:hypothetical protein
MDYKACTHTYDSGRACKSAAAIGREFCGYHLRYRGRHLRMAQYRARHQPFDITLPPLDSLCSIQSALSQVAEALAADMIDPRRAMGLLKALRFAKENLKDGLKDNNAHWHDTPYLSEDPAAYDNFEADYGLPKGLNLTAPPEVAFPPPDVILSEERSDESKDPYVSADGSESELLVRPDFPVTPEMVEIVEVSQTQGEDAAAIRAGQLQRNRHRRELVQNRKRYAKIALQHNLRRAAEKLAQQKLAAQKASAQNASPASDAAAKKAPATAGEAFAAEKEEAIA